jgi:hypothetical protein
MRHKLVHIFVLAAIVVLHGAQAQAQTGANCVLTPFQVDGQANSVISGVGGTGGAVDPDEVVDSSWIVDAVNAMGRSGEPLVPVNLVLIDDFGDPSATVPSPNVPHGVYVRAVTEQLLRRLPSDYASMITVTEVNLGAEFTDFDRLPTTEAVVTRVLQTDIPDGYTVWNMSFALLPCDSFDAAKFYADYRDRTAAGDTLFSLATFTGVSQTELGAFIASQDTSLIDPLHNYIQEYAASNVFIPVASAGNSAPVNAFLPAAWEDVLAVGGSFFANGKDSGAFPDWNIGEVMAPGRWYEVNVRGRTDYIAGTSFAAPGISVLMAAYLADPGSKCLFSDITRSGGLPFSNIPISDLIESYCP